MADTILAIQHIVSDPGVLSGRPRVAGTRIAVSHVITFAETGQSPADIAKSYDLTLAQVYAALAYYHDHTDEIKQQERNAEERARKHAAGSKDEYLKRRSGG